MILFLFACTVAVGIGLAYIGVISMRPQHHSRPQQAVGSERMEESVAESFYTACGFDNPEQFWEECLIGMSG
jgi:hypothetical protein